MQQAKVANGRGEYHRKHTTHGRDVAPPRVGVAGVMGGVSGDLGILTQVRNGECLKHADGLLVGW